MVVHISYETEGAAGAPILASVFHTKQSVLTQSML